MSESKVIEFMQEYFGEHIVDPEHSPIVFSYQVRLAVWMLQQNAS